MKKREEVKEVFDLTYLFKNEDEFFEKLNNYDFSKILCYEGKIKNNFREFINDFEKIEEEISKFVTYAKLLYDTDTTNSRYQVFLDKANDLYSKFKSKTSFVEIEILNEDICLDEELKYLEKYINDIKSKHILSQKEESLLSNIMPIFNLSNDVFSKLNNADIIFNKAYDKDGNKYEVSNQRFLGLLKNKDVMIRKTAYESLYTSYKNNKNVFSTLLLGKVKEHVIISKLRGYDSARKMALENNFISEDIYDSLIETVFSKKDVIHDYMKFRKDYFGLKEMYMYDVHLPLVHSNEFNFSFEEAKSIIIEALGVLGSEYKEGLEKAFDEKWIDYAENIGKRSGAYSTIATGVKPHILMTYLGNINNLYTLAHELGHSMHTYLASKYQKHQYKTYGIFLAEIASTMNENLLTNYLLKKYPDKRIIILNHWIDRVKSTVYRQTQFAKFEHLIHKLVEKGEVLTWKELSDLYLDINKDIYGNSIVYDDFISYEWARIPHFYYNYYVYQYATGFSISVELSNRSNMNSYLEMLKSGSSKYPMELLKNMDINIESCINNLFVLFDERMNSLKKELI